MSIIRRTNIKCIAATIFLCSGLFSSNAVAAEVTWRAVSHQLPGSARYEGTVPPFAKCVKEVSDGKMVIHTFGGGVLFPVPETLDAVRHGIVEMGMIWSGYWAGVKPVFGLVGSRPGDPINSFAETLYLTKQTHDIIAEAYKQVGVKYLGAFDYGPAEILMSTAPVSSLEDFEGKKIRTAGIGAEFYSRLGASPVSLTGTAIYQALQLGTVDMAEYNDWLVNMEMGFHEVTDYVIAPMLHTGSLIDKALIVNPAAWKNLPDDLKDVVLVCRDRARYLSALAYGIGNQKAKQKWLEQGVEIIKLPEEDVRKARKIAVQVILDYAKKGPLAEKYVKKYAQVLNDLGYTDIANALSAK